MSGYGANDGQAQDTSAEPVKDGLTIEKSCMDLKRAYQDKRSLLEREKSDFLYALGKQWSDEDLEKLKAAGIKPVTDNRIQPNIHLLTGLERQNRTDFKAFPEGQEDSLSAEIASILFKDSIKKSQFSYKSSDQFKDGITCGESHLELYLDYTESLTCGKPCWKKCDGNTLFPDPASREYDFSDAKFVYKITLDVDRGDLLNLYPEKKDLIEAATSGKMDVEALLDISDTHLQRRDYPKTNAAAGGPSTSERGFDLIERYYKKWVGRAFIGDYQTGEVKQAETPEKAAEFVAQYQAQIAADQQAYEQMVTAHLHGVMQGAGAVCADCAAQGGPESGDMGNDAGEPGETAPDAELAAPAPLQMSHADVQGQLAPRTLPPPPPQRDPARFKVISRMVPEIWCFAHVPGITEPLCDERAWFYPKWKAYPFVPYFARFSTAPLVGEDRALLVQGIVAGVKDAQEKHNKAEVLMLRHLNTTANSGWLSEEDAWVDAKKVQQFGTAPGVNLEFKAGKKAPQRINPSPLSQGHAQLSTDSAEAIKAQLGINSDLIATQQGGTDSGRAIALRQRQGLLMVQELYDNLTRTRKIAGRLLLSQLGEIYDTETAMKVLGDGFLKENFPPLMLADPQQPGSQKPMTDPKTGQPMEYDRDAAEVAIATVLSGTLEEYDVSVGEAVASETQRMAASAELTDLASKMPIPPEVLVRHSQLPESTKNEILSSIKQAQAAAAAAARPAPTLGAPAAAPGLAI
jgi:hypothetical protein